MIPLIGTLLAPRYHFDPLFLETEAAEARIAGIRIGERLMLCASVSELDLFTSLADQFSMPFLPNPEQSINSEQFSEFPAELLNGGHFLPLEIHDEYVHIVVTDPLDLDTIQQVALVTGLPVKTSLTLPSRLKQLIERYFEKSTLFSQSAGKIAREYEQHLQTEDALSLDEIRKRTEAEPVVKMATLIFNEAIKLGASDIHIEPSEHHATVRFRIDGLLHQHTELTRWMFSPLTSRIKILADMDISEKRSPQDGRIRFSFDNNPIDFRVSTLPTHFGEKTVIRILKHDHTLLDLANIGLSETTRLQLAELIEKPQGMIFVTGPTGSGKSSTLFASINRISHKAINITTIENPIEYKIEGVNQVQINEKAGVTFASALRSILRQDPDVILVGEIRDGETAQIAVQAAQTGHLVLSTLHTNDAVSAITRMRDLGVAPFLISSSLLAVVAQRLIRVLCPVCKREMPLSEHFRVRWTKTVDTPPPQTAFEAVGCDECNQSGYKGRIGLFELVVLNDSLRELITENATETALRRKLKEESFRSLVMDGVSKVEQGITTPDELFRVVQIDEGFSL